MSPLTIASALASTSSAPIDRDTSAARGDHHPGHGQRFVLDPLPLLARSEAGLEDEQKGERKDCRPQ